MRFSSAAAALAVLSSLPAGTLGAAKEDAPNPCTIKSETTGSVYDLSSLMLLPVEKEGKKDNRHRETSWMARGYDYGANFTLNFCAPVVEELENVQGLAKSRDARNVSAFYKKGGKTYSIGSVNTVPTLRSHKLVLNYTGGSPCDEQDGKRSLFDLDEREVEEIGKGEDEDGESHTTKEDKGKGDDRKKGSKGGEEDDDDDDEDEEDDDEDEGRKPNAPSRDKIRRKSTLISFLCQRDPAAPRAAISYVGSSPDKCTYVFEVRTAQACEGAASSSAGQGGGVGPAGVFGLIVLIAVAAYVIGGVAYQRTVMHQRGWKQLPNYGTWAGIWYFIKDLTIVLFSSCSRLLPSRRGGYNQLPTYSDRSRFSRNEDENRLIDQLDEEWDD